MQEFRIVKQIGQGKEFSLWTFTNFVDCYIKLLELINNQKKCVNNKYYVENDFFENEYNYFSPELVKFRVECREVNEWKVYREEKRKNNKIVMFKK